MKREELTEATPLPSTAALIDWFELSTKDRSFAEGIGAINVAAEGQVVNADGLPMEPPLTIPQDATSGVVVHVAVATQHLQAAVVCTTSSAL